jgi:predicted ribosomally synthesized peptide with SipW-like signal peptide
MKRYLIFGAIGPFIGGFLMLFATTVTSGYWSDTSWSEIGKFLGAFFRTLQYSYLFAIVPMLMLGAIDDILYHVKRIVPAVRMLIVAVIGFAVASLLYGSRGPDTGMLQFLLYGLVGMVPAMLSSWLAHRYDDAPQAPQTLDAES